MIEENLQEESEGHDQMSVSDQVEEDSPVSFRRKKVLDDPNEVRPHTKTFVL